MAGNRTISPDFWTWEAVIDCKPMTRLLFIGLWNFADDGGVQPLRPRTIRLQVFPGEEIGNDDVRAMIDELAAQGLVRIYEVEGQAYVAIVDWDQTQRIGKRAKRRYPPFSSLHEGQGPRTTARETVPGVGEADEGLSDSASTPNHSKPSQSPSPARAEEEKWQAEIEARLREAWPHAPSLGATDPAGIQHWIGRWIADGYDLERDVLAGVGELCILSADREPPAALLELVVCVGVSRAGRLAMPAAA